jgi:RNA-directed DNA polymerase
MAEQLTRQQIYDRIRETSKDEYIISEMKRLGFWKTDDGQPSVPEILIQKEGELHRELSELAQKQRKFENQQAMIAEMRKARLADSKKRQAETKQKQESKHQEKAANWKIQKDNNLLYLGEEVSGGLNSDQANLAQLEKFGLPNFENPLQLASAMKITLGKLRFLAFNRKVSTISHYKRFYLAKKSGGKRLISAPMPDLKAAQYWILENILYKIQPAHQANGFVPERSIVSNAQIHVNKDVVINLDLKDFFPTVSFKRVKGLFQKIGYSSQIATILALICTEADVEQIAIDGKIYYSATSERCLPQGAPSSPAITNLICYKLDHRFEGMSKKFGFDYTRYADDLTFSAINEGKKLVGQLLWSVKEVIKDEGFIVHPEKQKIMRKGFHQEVTGIVVNEKMSLNREKLHRFRALIHLVKTKGTEGLYWTPGKDLESSMRGFANFVSMIKPVVGLKFKNELNTIFGQTIKTEPITTTILPKENTNTSGKDWWEII